MDSESNTPESTVGERNAALSANYVAGDLYRQCVESGQAMGAEIDAVEEVLIDQAGVDGMSLADCARALLTQRDDARTIAQHRVERLREEIALGDELAKALNALIYTTDHVSTRRQAVDALEMWVQTRGNGLLGPSEGERLIDGTQP